MGSPGYVASVILPAWSVRRMKVGRNDTNPAHGSDNARHCYEKSVCTTPYSPNNPERRPKLFIREGANEFELTGASPREDY